MDDLADGLPTLDAKVRSIHRRWGLLGAAAAAGIGIVAVLLLTGSAALATPGQGQDLRVALSVNGTTFEPAEVQAFRAGLASSRSPEEAEKAAVDDYGERVKPVVYAGRLSIVDHQPAISDQPVYAIQLTGLSMAPFGGPATDKNLHTELIVFVDAVTGEVMLAETVR
jgi:hypothetical protein